MFLPPSHSPHLQDQHTISKGEDIGGTFERKQEHSYNISGKPKEVDPMRRTLMIITVALVLCLCGCSEVPQISDIPSEPTQSESLPIKKSEEISQETDALRKKGTICKVVRSYLPVFHIRRCRRSSSAPAGHLPPGGRYWPANLQFHDQLMKADSPNCLLCSSESFSSKEA